MKKRIMDKRIVSLLLVLVMVAVTSPVSLAAEDSPTNSDNRYGQNYSHYAASPVRSYLYENERGGLTRVEYTGSQIVAEAYDSFFQFQSGQTIPMELDVWGGFFAGETYNFFIFGQENQEENNNKEVIRVVKYSKDWQRLGQASLYGANTIVPFRSGSLRIAEYDGELYIRTSHQMYTTSDGLNHQANLSMAIRESDMAMLDSYYIVMNSSVGYVSHSFNQFVIVDQQQRIVTLDHGDAYPRSAVLMVYNTKAGQGKFSGSVSSATIQSFPGATGANTTGASLGGLAETNSGYVVAYNYDGAGQSSTSKDRSVYFAYVDKNSLSVKTKAISSAGTTTPVLAPTGLNGGYILWNASDDNGFGTDTLYYAAYSDGGNIGEIKTAIASLSDCHPIVYNGKLVWYTTHDSMPTFYQLDNSGVTAVKPQLQASAIPFTDVSATDYFYQPVNWAVAKNITSGTSDTTFSPDKTCTNAEILTFMWRAVSDPEQNYYNFFDDVKESDYFYKAAGWARVYGVLSSDSRKFSPQTPCTRAMVVEYLWRLEGSPEIGVASQFTDVPADASYAPAVAWAVRNGITSGTSSTTFAPNEICTRGQIVSFLYRALA